MLCVFLAVFYFATKKKFKGLLSSFNLFVTRKTFSILLAIYLRKVQFVLLGPQALFRLPFPPCCPPKRRCKSNKCFSASLQLHFEISNPGFELGSLHCRQILYHLSYLGSLSLSSVQFSHSVLSESLWPQGVQQAGLPSSSPTPRACSDSHSLSRWCHPTNSSSVILFSSHFLPFPAWGSF